MTDPQQKIDAIAKRQQGSARELRELLTKSIPELQKALPPGQLAQQFVRIALTTIQGNSTLAKCSPQSILRSAFEAASLGLLINGALGHAYLVPYGNQAQLQIGFRGFIELGHRAGFLIHGGAVRQGDVFDYEDGTNAFVKHVKRPGRGDLEWAWAEAKPYEHGQHIRVAVMLPEEVEQHRKASKSASSKSSPWNEWEDAMWTKTAIREVSKQTPQSSQLQQAAVADEQRDKGIDIGAQIVDVPMGGDDATTQEEDGSANT